jgi:MarR family transcriptional regulator, temperature-dependent positive regulator of motility
MSTPDMPAVRRSKVAPLHRVPAHLARRFNQICVGIGDEVTRPHGLSPVEFAILAAIDDAPGIDQKSLAARLAIDAVTTSKLIDRMEQVRLVRRSADASDRRARVLVLTEAGARLRAEIIPKFRAAHARLMSALSPAQQKQFLEMLVVLIESNESYARPGNGRRKPQRKRRNKEEP